MTRPVLSGVRPSSGLADHDSRASSTLPSPVLTSSSEMHSRTRLASSASSDRPSTPPTSSAGSAPLRSDDRSDLLLSAPRIHIQGLTLSPLPRILIIDHFDSYTRNLVPLLLAASRTASHDDSDRIVVLPYTSPALHPANFPALAAEIDAILISPGPGHPASANDFGPSAALLRGMRDGSLPIVPVLGVCLGFQGMAVLEGGKLREGEGAHGLRCSLEWTEGEGTSGIYKGLDQAKTEVVRYNSLVLADEDLPPSIIATSWSSTALPTAPDPSPEALSLLTSPAFAPRPPRPASRPERIVMSLRHTSLPFVGVQYHPESIESQFGHAILANWISDVWSFWAEKGEEGREKDAASDEPKPLPHWIRSLDANFAGPSVDATGLKLAPSSGSLDLARIQLLDASTAAQNPDLARHAFWTLFLRRGWSSRWHPADGEQWWEGMSKRRQGEAGRNDGCVWLDSARSGDPQSQYSYMARPSFWLAYDVSTRCITVRARGDEDEGWRSVKLPLREGETFWTFVDEAQREVQSRLLSQEEGNDGPPFRAGFVGFWGYEMHGESLPPQGTPRVAGGNDVTPSAVQTVADAEMGWAEAVLQIDHATGEWHGCGLVRSDDVAPALIDAKSAFGRLLAAAQEAGVPPTALLGQERSVAEASLAQLRDRVQRLALHRDVPHPLPPPKPLATLTPVDDATLYKAKVEGARSAISKGDSYELCLTTHFVGRQTGLSGEDEEEGSETVDGHFGTYLWLRGRNPAPFAAFISLPCNGDEGSPRTLLSTSPERFISLSSTGVVEMRPIKGTVPRAGYDVGEERMRATPGGDTREEEVKLGWREKEDAKRRNALECDAKERAENLMIVDLIRSDLLTFCVPRSVVVPRLMHVETYETLHQLVTTVRGVKLGGVGSLEGVRRAFPPGSMTGAPKVRSVELLQELEHDRGAKKDGETRRRGPYSGAMGWCDVGGAACYAVIIRTLIAHGRDFAAGAGGAVTYLSSPEREWKECCDKAKTLADVRGVD